MKINVLNTQGIKTNRVFSLNEQIFDCQKHESILRQAIHVHLTNTSKQQMKYRLQKQKAEVKLPVLVKSHGKIIKWEEQEQVI